MSLRSVIPIVNKLLDFIHIFSSAYRDSWQGQVCIQLRQLLVVCAEDLSNTICSAFVWKLVH